MNYEQVLVYLYEKLPMFQREGKVAFKKDLTNTIALLEALCNPHQKFKSIHVAGTNGKGSSSHALAAILQAAGYKTGLYTSPHLKEFTERIRINGVEIDANYVAEFVTKNREHIERINPSFFEVTVAMAFDYFATSNVDIAVIETGLGGRLDSTNVITPVLSLITMIGFDHADILGDTLEKIASEKAGIIKSGVPVVIGADQPDLNKIYQHRADELNSPILFSKTKCIPVEESLVDQVFDISIAGDVLFSNVQTDITARYFLKNVPGVFEAVGVLRDGGFEISDDAVRQGFASIKRMTGLKGRWQILNEKPLVIADVSHNEPGVSILLEQIAAHASGNLHLIIGMVKDKEIEKILTLLPGTARFYFTQSSVPRSMKADELQQRALKMGVEGNAFTDVNDAIQEAKNQADVDDLILICGSTFVVAEIEGL